MKTETPKIKSNEYCIRFAPKSDKGSFRRIILNRAMRFNKDNKVRRRDGWVVFSKKTA